MGWSGHFMGVLIVALVIGALWLSLRYRARNASSHGGDDLSQKLDDLTDLAGRMQSRIETLERLLDAGQNKGKFEP